MVEGLGKPWVKHSGIDPSCADVGALFARLACEGSSLENHRPKTKQTSLKAMFSASHSALGPRERAIGSGLDY